MRINSWFSCSLASIVVLFTAIESCPGQGSTINVTNYDIEVSLDIYHHEIVGAETIQWINNSPDTVDHLLLHVYYNAFRNNQSTFFLESDRLPEIFRPKDCEWGGTDFQSIRDSDGKELILNSFYVNTDTENKGDKTVFKINLNKVVLPGDTCNVFLKWKSKVPKSMVRTGYNKDFYFFAQWFPKLGVYEATGMRYAKKGAWNCHEYHAQGEYNGEFGRYKVTMKVPENYFIASTGSLRKETIEDGIKIMTFEESNIIDFAWAASPGIVMDTVRWKGTDIILATHADHLVITDRYFTSVINSLEYLDQYIGRYPYKTLTVIDPPLYGTFCSGMEYPTLITTLGFRFLPAGFKSTETLTTHELIHQYFMQMVATNEQEEPWMDEGITTYYEGRILDHYLGKQNSFIDFLSFHIGNSDYNRGEFFMKPGGKYGNNTLASREFPSESYGPVSYNKTALWLLTLEGMIGRECFDECMKIYFERWQFRHPCASDFIAVFNEIVRKYHGDRFGENLDWYFDQTMKNNIRCDYAIDEIKEIKATNDLGLFETIDSCAIRPQRNNENYRYSVLVSRKEEMVLPVEIKFYFANDSTSTTIIHDPAYEIKFNVASGKKLIKAELDPERKIFIDENFINNSYVVNGNNLNFPMMWMSLSEKTGSCIDFLISFI